MSIKYSMRFWEYLAIRCIEAENEKAANIAIEIDEILELGGHTLRTSEWVTYTAHGYKRADSRSIIDLAYESDFCPANGEGYDGMFYEFIRAVEDGYGSY